jgi:nicotinate-nucleotide adenylyltransferase
MKKTGLFFGSFNPIHIGHLIIANYFVENTDIQEVWFVISPHNPLKSKKTLLDDHQRYYMVQLATEDNSKFKASNIEFQLPQPSYTIHTLSVLSEKYPDHQFVLLMGSDNLKSFDKWKNHEQIQAQYEIYVYQRPENIINQEILHPNIKLHHAPLMQISSSYIRGEIIKGKNVEYFLPAKVFQYLTEMNLYRK